MSGLLIRRIRKSKGWTLAELEGKTGLSRAYLSLIERDVRPPSLKILKRISEAFEMDYREFLGGEKDSPSLTQRVARLEDILREGLPIKPIPILNRIPAGFPEGYADKEYPPGTADEYVSLPDVKDLNAFALKIEGDSMAPRLKPGDMVIVSPNRQWENGDIVVVKVKEEVSLKKIFRKETTLVLQSMNTEYPPLILPFHEVQVIGKVILRVERF